MITILLGLPKGFLHGLDPEDQFAIRQTIGKPVSRVPVEDLCYPDYHKTEVKFKFDGATHTIWIEEKFLHDEHVKIG